MRILLLTALCVFVHAQARSEITIRFWHFLDVDTWSTFGRLVEEFNASHDGVKVVGEYQGGPDLLTQKVFAAIVAGVPPELATVSCSDIAQLSDTGRLVPIELSADEKEDIFPAVQKAYTYKNRLWALPLEGAAYCLYWNARLFKEAGLEQRPPRTWEELIAFGKALTRDTDGDGETDQWGFLRYDKETVGSSTIFNLYFSNEAPLLSEDGGKVLFAAPNVVEVLQLWADLADKYRITDRNMPPYAVQRERVGMWIGGSWNYRELRENKDIHVGPIPPMKRKASLANPDAIVITKTTRAREEAAREFVRWILDTPQFARICLEQSSLPVRESILLVPEYRDRLKEDPTLLSLVDMMRNVQTKPLQGCWRRVQDALDAAREKVEHGLMDPRLAANEAQQVGQQLLTTYNAERQSSGKPADRRTIFRYLVLPALAFLSVLAFLLLREYRRLGRNGTKINWGAYLLIMPQALLFLIFGVMPICFVLYLSLFRWDMLSTPVFIGLDNYVKALNDPGLAAAFKRTAIWVLATVPMGTALSLAMALLLNSRVRGIAWFRMFCFTPQFTSAVALAVIWWWVLSGREGVFNSFLGIVGAQQLLSGMGITPIDWTNDPHYTLLGLIVMEWWCSLGSFLVFLAALQEIPETLYEAARVDGANRWIQFRHVTLPLLKPAAAFVVITSIITAFQVFDQIYVMTLGSGGIGDCATTVSMYIYRVAFGEFRLGYACAIAIVLGMAIFTVTLFQWRVYRGSR